MAPNQERKNSLTTTNILRPKIGIKLKLKRSSPNHQYKVTLIDNTPNCLNKMDKQDKKLTFGPIVAVKASKRE